MALKQCLYVALFAILMASAIKCEEEETEYAKELTDKTLEEAIKENNYFIMFYAPWCGHCKRLHPLWEQLAEIMNVKDDPNLIIAKVDCTVEREVCGKYKVSGYPTLNFFRPSVEAPVKFVGTRDMQSLTEFINKQLRNDEENEIPQEDNEIVEKPTAASTGKMVELTEENFAKHIATGNHFVKFYAPWCSHCQRLAPTWDELAQTLQNVASVSIAKIDCTVYRPICQDFEVKGYPTLLWIEDGKKIEKYSGGRDLDTLKSYVDKMLASATNDEPTEEPGQKQEEPAKEEDSNQAINLTAEDFEKTIAQGVVFVKFFAPWCGHCQQLAPTWDKLAEKMHAAKNGIQIAKVDCTVAQNKNLCIEQQVEGYPSLFAFKDGEKQTEYDGTRSLDELQHYISKLIGHDEL